MSALPERPVQVGVPICERCNRLLDSFNASAALSAMRVAVDKIVRIGNASLCQFQT